MRLALDVVSAVLLLSGVSLAVIAGIGLNRFPDVFARMHTATKPATLGLVLTLSGAALQMDEPGDVAKLLLVAFLQFVTAPVGAHMVGRTTHQSGGQLDPDTVVDELGQR